MKHKNKEIFFCKVLKKIFKDNQLWLNDINEAHTI